MRDPLSPIPSPSSTTSRSDRFWHPSALPPPPPSTDALLDIDTRGIDRRHAPRDIDGPPGSSTTAALHERVSPRLLALRSRQGWTLVRGLTLAPTGLLVIGVDLHDPHVAAEATRILPALAPTLGASRRAGPRGCNSLLALVGGCVLAPRLLEDLVHWGALDRPSGVPVTLLVPDARGRAGEPPALAIDGRLAPLTDPGPDVLAIAFPSPAHAVLRPHLVDSAPLAR